MENEDILIYPNPFSSKLNISFQELNSDVRVSIFSIQGRKVFEKNLKEQTPGPKVLNLSKLLTGVYVLSLEYNDVVKYRKIVKH